jgi:hypothetical protein
MRSLNSRLLFAGLSPWLLAACTNGVCVDDGFAGNQDKEACAQASATATESNTDTDTDTDSASASASVSVSVTATMGTMSASGSTTASATDTDTESDSATVSTTSGGVDWCVDADKDGYGDPENCMPGTPGEDPPDGYVEGGEDCNDGDPDTFPGAAEKDDPEACMTDADDDGYGDDTPSGPGVIPGTDCDDADGDTFPGAAENEDARACMKDGDGDGYGDSMPENPDVTPGGDCDDSDGFTFPGAAENESETECMRDEDGDGYGDANVPPGVVGGADCYDANADMNPGNEILFSVLEGGDVGEVDVDSGAISVIGTVDILGLEGEWSVISAAVSPDNGMTYVANAAQSRLAMMDYCTADAPTELTVHGRSICGLSFNQDGILYGVDSNSDELVTFDTETGSVNTAVTITLDDVPVNIAACGMAFDCATTNLLISDSLQKRILNVDPETGVATVAATLDVAPGAGLAYNALNKSVLSNSLKSLYEIALDGSNTSELKSTLVSSVNDLDFGPICQ